MRDAMKNLPTVLKCISKRGCLLILDFDGTLSPIVQHPDDAVLPAHTKELLKKAVKLFPIIIISGRPLADIRRRVGVRGIVYAGNHGYEWQLGSRRYRHAVPASTTRTLKEAKAVLMHISRSYPHLIRENKSGSFALNYRALAPREARAFQSDALLSVSPYLARDALRLMDSLCTFEISADADWTKGHCAMLLYKTMGAHNGPKKVPVYIGDSLTDEDGFRAFQNGITIRVGRKNTSAARYYVGHQKDVGALIAKLTRVTANPAAVSKYTRRARTISRP